ncbi:MAG: DUF4861 domain-containing protein [Rikenellaceae bacterium]|jgi:hypothetical protein|nr:DUF4861 domain-containing protein [Rikenellaceae bacterium]
MKNITLLFSLALASCCAKSVKVEVTNNLDFDRSSEMVSLDLADLAAQNVVPAAGRTFVVKNAAGDVIPSQATCDGKLIFQSGLTGAGAATFAVSTGKPAVFEPRTHGRLVPERMDDFAWENDRVAFRLYGPALVDKDGPSNGIDLWYKRTEALFMDRAYAAYLDNGVPYHEDHGEGLDNFDVKRSLGAGAMAPYVDGKLILGENFASSELLDNGPLRTTFRLTYNPLDVEGQSVSETRTISIDAGSQLSRIVQEYGFAAPAVVAAGIVLHAPDEVVASSCNWIMAEEPATPAAKGVCLGVVVPQGMDSVVRDSYVVPAGQVNSGKTFSHLLALTAYNGPVTYYAGYGWELFGFPTPADFKTYLDNFSQALANPLTVKIQ